MNSPVNLHLFQFLLIHGHLQKSAECVDKRTTGQTKYNKSGNKCGSKQDK